MVDSLHDTPYPYPTTSANHLWQNRLVEIYTSNLDVAKIWERVLRRADLPILYTQGFNTRPRIQLAMALPLGITSECELLDVALRRSD